MVSLFWIGVEFGLKSIGERKGSVHWFVPRFDYITKSYIKTIYHKERISLLREVSASVSLRKKKRTERCGIERIPFWFSWIRTESWHYYNLIRGTTNTKTWDYNKNSKSIFVQHKFILFIYWLTVFPVIQYFCVFLPRFGECVV